MTLLSTPCLGGKTSTWSTCTIRPENIASGWKQNMRDTTNHGLTFHGKIYRKPARFSHDIWFFCIFPVNQTIYTSQFFAIFVYLREAFRLATYIHAVTAVTRIMEFTQTIAQTVHDAGIFTMEHLGYTPKWSLFMCEILVLILNQKHKNPMSLGDHTGARSFGAA